MQQLTALRPLATAGAAALGASLIALTPAIPNDVASDLQRSAANIEHHAVQLLGSGTVDPGVVNPIQTWMDLLQTANQSTDVLYNQWLNLPAAPALQQVAANWTQYVSDYIGAYQKAANGGVTVFLGNTGGSSWPSLAASMFTDLQSDNFIGAFNAIYDALLNVEFSVLEPLEGIPALPGYALTNLAAGYSYLAGPGLTTFGLLALLDLPLATLTGLGQGFQNIYDAYATGDWPAVFTNALNFPGVVTNYFLNGGARGTGVDGLLSNPTVTGGTGTVYGILHTILPTLTKDIVAPGAQKVSQGGSLAIALPALVNQIFNGWPSPSYAVDTLIDTAKTYAGVDLSGLTGAASVGGLAALAPAAELPGLSADLLHALDPAAVTNIAASLGPSLAADVAGSLGSSLGANLGSLATTLSVDLSTMALHILSAL